LIVIPQITHPEATFIVIILVDNKYNYFPEPQANIGYASFQNLLQLQGKKLSQSLYAFLSDIYF